MTAASPSGPRTYRDLADDHVHALAELDPVFAVGLGLRPGEDRMPDLSPAGHEAIAEQLRATLARLDRAEEAAPPAAGHERRCARLLRERLTAALAVSASGEHLRDVRNMMGAVQRVQSVFTMMPTATEQDWAVVAARMARVPETLAGYTASLRAGMRGGLLAAPLQVRTLTGQLGQWLAASGGRGWFTGFSDGAPVPAPLRAELDRAGAAAAEGVAELRRWLAEEYLPLAEGTPDGVGAERYRIGTRLWTGADLDLTEVYEWGWAEYRRVWAEAREQAGLVLPGSSPLAAMRHLDTHGEVVHGTEQIRQRLHRMTETAMDDLDGTHFDITGPMRVIETVIAPEGSAAAPYYMRPSRDFSRPGRTHLPTLGKDTFPLWNLVSTWYHEGVPGHHLQLAQWTALAEELSMFQFSAGSVSATTEGWALYAERLMDELGYLTDPGARLGYLDAQLMRAVRVVIDIGMHLGLEVPADSPVGAGERWTPALAREFFGAHSGRDGDFLDSEIVRYLGSPGQAISYKLGERAWLAGRDAARTAAGADFDLKSWHMAALSLGALGLDDLGAELARL